MFFNKINLCLIFFHPPKHKSCKQPQPFEMEWPSVTLRLKFKSVLPLTHSHSHGNSHQEWFCCHYFQAFTLVPGIRCCVHGSQKGNEHQSHGMNSDNCQRIGWKSDTSQEICLFKKYVLMCFSVCLFVFLSFFFLAIPHHMQNFPNQGLKLCPQQWKPGILTTGPLGKYKCFSIY